MFSNEFKGTVWADILDSPGKVSPEQERALYRKVDRRVMIICAFSQMLPVSERGELLCVLFVSQWILIGFHSAANGEQLNSFLMN